MNKANIMKNTLISSLMIGALSIAAGTASAATVDLCAGATTTTLPDASVVPGTMLPDGNIVPMWGYALGGATVTPGVCDNPPTFPGPEIRVLEGDTALTITLTNTLADPTSIVIPGLPMPTPAGPTWDDGSPPGARCLDADNCTPLEMAKRVRSFGAETGASLTATYTWTTGLRPGTFIYHSGTHPQKQVYMGLYGAVIQNAKDADTLAGTPAEAYDGVEYFNEVVLFYSEIDTDQNNAVAGGTHETSIHYQADWFLVNGEPYGTACTDDLIAGNPPTPGNDDLDDASGYPCDTLTQIGMVQTDDIYSGTNGGLIADQKTLVRFLSTAGETHVPTIQGMHMSIHAEDGFEYNWQDGTTQMGTAARQQYSVMMPPLKTKDVIISAPADGRYAIYDGNGYMTNPTDSGNPEVTDPVGGMLRFLAFGTAVNQAPIADPNGPYSGAVGSPVAFDGSGSTDDGAVDSYAWDFGDTNVGTEVAPSHTYTAPGTYTVSLTVTDDGGLPSTPVTTTATITPNSPPVANPGLLPYTGITGVAVAFDGTGSSDPDGSVASYAWDFGDPNDLTAGTGATPSHTYTVADSYTVTLTVTDDGGLPSAPVMTAATIADNVPPTAEANGDYTGATGAAIVFDSTGSNDDTDGFIVSYAWDFGYNDGDGDPVTGTGPSPSHSYAVAGDYTVTLTVTDNLGGTGDDIAMVTITTANLAPIAEARGPYSVSLPLELGIVEFDASWDPVDETGSYDPDGTIVSYDWDFGDPNDATPGSGPTPTHQYTASSTYIATLTVTDNSIPPLTGTDTAVVYVVDTQPPIAKNDSVSVARRSNTLIDVLANDLDGDGTIDPSTIVIMSQPSTCSATPDLPEPGCVQVVSDQVVYTPPNGNSPIREALQVRYTVDDSLGNTSNVAIVTIRVIR